MGNKEDVRKTIAGEALFCLSLLSIFFALKIYPLTFLLTACYFIWERKAVPRRPWMLALGIFMLYSLLHFAFSFTEGTALPDLEIKLLVNLFFLIAAVQWLGGRENKRLLRWTDYTLHIVLFLSLLQLLVYHHAWDYQLLNGSSSSGESSRLYRERLFFWSLPDKNMFGARVALLGLIYLLIPVVKERRLSLWRVVAVALLAFLSLSRTPVVALLIGIVWLCVCYFPKRGKIAVLVASAIAIPIVLHKALRLEQITASNDGMGVRLTYWRAFADYWKDLPPLGGGLNSGGRFLDTYAAYYHGEPHIHNTLMTCYLDFGWIGLLSYGSFLFFFFRDVDRLSDDHRWTLVLLFPVLAILMILYSGYDNDLVIYFALAGLLTSQYKKTRTIRLSM